MLYSSNSHDQCCHISLFSFHLAFSSSFPKPGSYFLFQSMLPAALVGRQRTKPMVVMDHSYSGNNRLLHKNAVSSHPRMKAKSTVMFQPGCLYSFSDRALVDRTRWPLFSMDDCSCQAPWLPHEIVDIVPMTSFILPATPFDQLYSLALDDVQCYGVSGPASCAWIDCCDYYSTTTAKGFIVPAEYIRC